MTPASQGFKDLLLTHGFTFGTQADWSIFIGRKPDKPVRCIVIRDSGGKPPNPRWLLDYPSVQVTIRGGVSDYQDAYLKAQEVKRYLLGLSNAVVNGDAWLSVLMPSDVSLLGFDQLNQPEFVMNFNLIVEPAQGSGDNRDPL